MTMLSYAGIDLGQVRTTNYTIEVVRDPSNVDLLYQRVTLEVTSVMNLYWLATGRNPVTSTDSASRPAIGPGGAFTPGDSMGVTLAKIRAIVGRDRQQLLYSIGKDLVLESPPRLPDGTQLSCDCDNGPKVEDFRIAQIVGDVTAIVSFKVSTTLNDCGNYLLSNRWRTAHHVDDSGYTTRTTTGHAVIRADFANNPAALSGPLTIDKFRRFLFVPADQPFRREDIQVTVSEDNCTADYTVVDVETTYGITDPQVTKIEGTCTAGAEISATSEIARFSEKAGAITSALTGNILAPLTTGLPRGRANICVRVYGHRKSHRKYLTIVALDVATDRFMGSWQAGEMTFASLYITQSFGSEDPPFVELRAELFLHDFSVDWFQSPFKTIQVMNFELELKNIATGRQVYGYDSARPAIGESGNTRGRSLVATIIYQALSGTCQLPPSPPVSPGLGVGLDAVRPA